MKQWNLVRINRDNQQEYAAYIPDVCWNALLNTATVALGVNDENGIPAGAVVAYTEEDVIHIASVFVAEQYRGNGAGKVLVDTLKNLAQRINRYGLTVEYSIPEYIQLESFFKAQGFNRAMEGNKIYYIPMAEVKTSDMLTKATPSVKGEIVPVSKLSELIQYEWYSKFGNLIPDDLNPKKIGGEYLADDSFVYLVDGKVGAFVTYHILEDGVIYLSALYAVGKYNMAIMELLKKSINNVCEKYPDKTLCFSAATESSVKIAQNLCEGHGDNVKIKTMWTALWTAENSGEEFVADDIYALIPRVNGLGGILTGLEIENEAILDTDDVPHIIAKIGGVEVLMQYQLVSLENEDFILTMMADAEGVAADFNIIDKCDEFNNSGSYATAVYIPEIGGVILKASLIEQGGYKSNEEIEYAVKLFAADVKRFIEQNR